MTSYAKTVTAVTARGFHAKARPLFDPHLLRRAVIDSFKKLSPRTQIKNPVMFVVYIGAILTTALFFQALTGTGEAPAGFILAVTLWLWFTVLFANFAEAIAEGRGKAQAETLRGARRDTPAKKLERPNHGAIQQKFDGKLANVEFDIENVKNPGK